MKCEHITHQIEQLSLDDIDNENSEIRSRIKECDVCMNQYQRHIAYLYKMQSITTPSLHPSVSAKMLSQVSHQAQTARNNNGFLKGFIAASVLCFAVLGAYTTFTQEEHLIANAPITEYIDKNISIVIHSKNALYDAELDLVLPEEVTIAGYENIQNLTWPVDLEKGANVLELPVRVHTKHTKHQPLSILATLYHDADERNFEFNVDLTKS